MTDTAFPAGRPGDTRSLSGSVALRLLSDERLARRAAKGDRSAFEAIFRRYEQDLYRFCLTMTGDSQDAQEALQNAMVKVLRALPGERRQIRLKPWLYRIARNESVEVLRRRRDGVEIDTQLIASADGVSETAEARERLSRLFADLEQLPERQRAALVMREMGGVGFEQIGESFGTSAAVARQTVYEARLSLRRMEEGREMGCDAVTRALSDADGRVARRRDIRSHLRECERCRAFRDGIEERRGELAAIAPLPVALSAGLLQGALGAGKASAAAAGVAGGGVVAKSAATVAIVAAIGVTTADRGGLVDVPVLGGGDASEQSTGPGSSPAERKAASSRAVRSGAAVPAIESPSPRSADGKGGKDGGARRGSGEAVAGGAAGSSPPVTVTPAETGHGKHRGRPEGLPPASQRGQETATAKKPAQAATPPGPGGSGGGGEGANPPQPPAPPPPPASLAGKPGGPPDPSAPPPPPPAEPPAPNSAAIPPGHPGKGKGS